MVPLNFAVYAERSVTIHTKKLQFQILIYRTIPGNFWLLGKLPFLMFKSQLIAMMSPIACRAKIGVLSLAVPSRIIIITKIAKYFLYINTLVLLEATYICFGQLRSGR